MNLTLSQRAQKLTSSVIREILKITERPEVTSFAGGLPSPDTFPVERVLASTHTILTTAPTPALQYGPTEGYMQLREWIAARHSTGSVRIDPADVLVTTGSQQALDLLLLKSGLGQWIDRLEALLRDGLFGIDLPLIGDALDDAADFVASLRDAGDLTSTLEGAINGQLGQETRSAILKFERDRGIAPTGDISATLIAELDKMSARSAN